MGYGEHLRELLRPLGIYDLTSGAGGGELTAAGAAMDDLGAAPMAHAQAADGVEVLSLATLSDAASPAVRTCPR